MKKYTKIITLILSALLLIGCAIGISVSAEEGAPSVSVKFKNISYEGAVKVLYAVEAQNVPEGAKVQMAFFNEMPTAVTDTPAYVKDAHSEDIEIGGATYKAFFSDGIAPKNMRKALYAVPVITQGDEIVAMGDPVEYSVYTYAINMMAKAPTEEQKALYTNLLDYGASVQRLLLGTEDYTAADLEAAGGYADEYCGIKVATTVNNVIVEETALPGYYAPGTAVDLTADLYKDGAMFTGFANEALEMVGNYSYTVTAYATEPGVTTFYKTYKNNYSVDDYNKGYISTDKYNTYAKPAGSSTQVGHANNYIVGSSGNNAIVNYGTEEKPNYALQHSHTAGKSSSNISYLYDTVGEAYVFEADFCFGGATGTKNDGSAWQGRIGFVSAATAGRGSELNFTAYSIMYAKDNEAMTFNGVTLPIDKWIHLRFEYVPLGYNPADYRASSTVTYHGYYTGIFRIYQEGTLVYEATQVTDVDNTDCLYFQFSNRGSSSETGDFSFKIDNSVCYTVQENYYGKGLYNDLANDYEDGNAIANTTIATDFDGNKLISFTSLSGKNPAMNFNLSSAVYAETYVFDTDIYFDEMPISSYGRPWIGRMGFVTAALKDFNEDDHFARCINYGATPVQGMLLGTTSSGSIKKDDFAAMQKLIPGVWHNLRIEYTPLGTDADGYYLGNQKIYVDGELLYDVTSRETMLSKNTATRGTTKNNLGLVGFQINTLSANTSTFKLDNTYLGYIGENDAFRANDFQNPAKVNSHPYVTLESTNAGCATQSIVANPVATDAKSAANNVLKIVTNPDSDTSKVNHDINTIALAAKNEAATAEGVYVFEFDILSDRNTALPAQDSIFMQFVMAKGGSYTELIRLTYKGDGDVYFQTEMRGTQNGTNYGGKKGNFGTAKILDGQWHNVKFLYEKNGANTYLSLYVDGELISRINTYYQEPSTITNSVVPDSIAWRIKEFVPADDTATEMTYYMDNVNYYYVGTIAE